MDVNSETNLGESSRSSILDFIYDSLSVDNSPLLVGTCDMCHRSIPSDHETVAFESITICGDCKFLLLEDLQISSPDIYQRRLPQPRRIRYGSSESIESMFSQQFSQIINTARQNQSTFFDRDDQSMDDDGAVRSVQNISSRTTPIVSRRWRRVVSDTESDGFDSVYVETELNVSFRRYMLFHDDTDTLSYSVYGGDSDASVGGHSVLGNDNFTLQDERTDVDSDTDIDPMNAGLFHWNSEDQEGDDEGDSEWEGTDIQSNNTVESSSNGNNAYVYWRSRVLSPEVDGTSMFRIQERIRAHTTGLSTNFEESEAQINIGDYLDATGFENLLENLAETENSVRGAPPASESFVKNMKLVKNKEENLSCAICKDLITVGTVVNHLPCLHFYHTNCILPWLSARNTCPLCRYELPTDDKDYEERKGRSGDGFRTLAVHRINVNENSHLDVMNDLVADEPEREINNVRENGGRENGRNRWFFLAAAAAPIVSVVGISFMLWFRKPPNNQITYRREGGQRRWWSF